MIENKYNIDIRNAISNAYIECSKERKRILEEIKNIEYSLSNKNKITYQEYLDKSKYLEITKQELIIINAKLNTWDEARELILNCIDKKL